MNVPVEVMSTRDDNARNLIAKGYRVHTIKVTYTIPVLCKPGEVAKLLPSDLRQWIDDGGGDPIVTGVEGYDAKHRDALPFVEDDVVEWSPPTIGELLDAAKEQG